MIAHIILNVKDFSSAEAFYDRILYSIGFVCNHRENADGVSVKSYIKESHNLWIRHDGHNPQHEFVRNVGLDHIALLAGSKDEVDRLFALVSTFNVVITNTPKHYPEYTAQYYAFYFRDPSGIPLEICVM